MLGYVSCDGIVRLQHVERNGNGNKALRKKWWNYEIWKSCKESFKTTHLIHLRHPWRMTINQVPVTSSRFPVSDKYRVDDWLWLCDVVDGNSLDVFSLSVGKDASLMQIITNKSITHENIMRGRVLRIDAELSQLREERDRTEVREEPHRIYCIWSCSLHSNRAQSWDQHYILVNDTLAISHVSIYWLMMWNVCFVTLMKPYGE